MTDTLAHRCLVSGQSEYMSVHTHPTRRKETVWCVCVCVCVARTAAEDGSGKGRGVWAARPDPAWVPATCQAVFWAQGGTGNKFTGRKGRTRESLTDKMWLKLFSGDELVSFHPQLCRAAWLRLSLKTYTLTKGQELPLLSPPWTQSMTFLPQVRVSYLGSRETRGF